MAGCNAICALTFFDSSADSYFSRATFYLSTMADVRPNVIRNISLMMLLMMQLNMSRYDNPGTQEAPRNNAIQLKLFNAIIKIPMCDTSLCSDPPSPSLMQNQRNFQSIANPCQTHIHIEPNNTVTTPCFKTLHYTRADFCVFKDSTFQGL